MSIVTAKKPRGRPGRKRKRGRRPKSTLTTVQPQIAKQGGRKRKRGRRPAGKKLPAKKVKMQTIEIISRKGQPRPIAEVPVLIQSASGGPVSSSWISSLAWDKRRKEALMYLKNGYFYAFKIPFNIYQRWYYAHSKGTFFNEIIKGKYTYKRLR